MKWILAPFIFFVLLTILFLNKIVTEERSLSNKIYPNVYVNNINFGRKTKQEVAAFFSKKNKNLGEKNITVLFEDQPIATFSAQQLQLGYDAQGTAERAFLIGRSDHKLSQLYQRFATIFNWQKFSIESHIDYDRSKIRDFINEYSEQRNKPAKNALFAFENGRVVSFKQEEKGLEINQENFISDFYKLTHSFEKEVKNRNIVLTSKVIEPEITLAESNDFGIEELVAEGKSDFSGSIPERIHNIILATSKFHGVLIPKDKVFSFNEIVGDISSLTGYKQAYIIKAGKTVLGDGGGVCQVSTTLFRAALNAGLPIIERTPHAYRVGYYENDSKPGFDATVYAPSVDLKIKNDSPASLLVQTEVDEANNLLYFRFYGKKDERSVEISQVTVYDVLPPLPDLRQDDPTLKKGVVKQVDFPAWGAKAVFDYKVTKNGESSFEKKFFSSYRPWQAVYLVGTAD
ncbi:VanW family protein [Candidatus Roizmanbacteria bacterium]|nr:VanW family protein [Candidatus Roizmanbacteria bacterium]